MVRTYQPKKRQRSKVHGFRKRMATANGRKVLARRRAKGRVRLPMGTLADRKLRRKRIEAHKGFNQLWESGLMGKKQAYCWLQAKLGLPEQEVHIGRFSVLRCEQVVRLCKVYFPAISRAA